MGRVGAYLIRVNPHHPFHLWSILSRRGKLNSPGRLFVFLDFF